MNQTQKYWRLWISTWARRLSGDKKYAYATASKSWLHPRRQAVFDITTLDGVETCQCPRNLLFSLLLSAFNLLDCGVVDHIYRCGNTWRFNSSFYQLWLRNLILDRASGHNVLSAKRECLHGGSCSNYSRRMASRKPNVWWEKRYVLNHTGSPAYPCHSLVRVLWNATFPPTLEILAIACHSLSQVPLARWKNNTNQTQNNKVLKLWARLVNMKTDVHCDICTSYAQWVLGMDIVEEFLDLGKDATCTTRWVSRELGNMSSPTTMIKIQKGWMHTNDHAWWLIVNVNVRLQ